MTGRHSKEKGKRGEREVARLLTEAGFPAHRAQQYKGSDHSADVICPLLDGVFHIEVKRTERCAGPTWLAQCHHDDPTRIPLVFFRKSRHPWRYLTSGEGVGMLGLRAASGAVEDLIRALWRRYDIDPSELEA